MKSMNGSAITTNHATVKQAQLTSRMETTIKNTRNSNRSQRSRSLHENFTGIVTSTVASFPTTRRQSNHWNVHQEKFFTYASLLFLWTSMLSKDCKSTKTKSISEHCLPKSIRITKTQLLTSSKLSTRTKSTAIGKHPLNHWKWETSFSSYTSNTMDIQTKHSPKIYSGTVLLKVRKIGDPLDVSFAKLVLKKLKASAACDFEKS